ncbi:MAG: alpha/beta hydrolase [Pseudomonadota bacterium]
MSLPKVLAARLLPRRLPPAALNAALRITAKRLLARAQDPVAIRQSLETDGAVLFRHPPGAAYQPVDLPAAAGPALWARARGSDEGRTILYLHGGAHLAGSPRTHRHLAAALAGAAGARALVIDYRLAPEHPLPAGLADARGAWDWLLAQGTPPGRIVLAGDSAGGGMALSLLAALTDDRAAMPGAVVAFSPWTDLRGTAASLVDNARSDAMLPAHRLADVVARLLAPGIDASDWRVSPLLATYRRPPPAMIFASMDEILLDDAVQMAEVLRRAEGDPELELRQGLPHAWPLFYDYLEAANADVARAGAFIARTVP